MNRWKYYHYHTCVRHSFSPFARVAFLCLNQTLLLIQTVLQFRAELLPKFVLSWMSSTCYQISPGGRSYQTIVVYSIICFLSWISRNPLRGVSLNSKWIIYYLALICIYTPTYHMHDIAQIRCSMWCVFPPFYYNMGNNQMALT